MEGTNSKSRNQPDSDQELIRRVLAGDNTAFSELMDRYMKIFMFQAYQYVHNYTDAEEVVQDGFIQMHKHLGNLQNPEKFYPWAKAIIKNVGLQKYNKMKREKNVLLKLEEETKIQEQSHGDQSSLEHRARRETILRAMSQLGDKYQEVSIPYFSQGLTAREIAKKCHLSVQAVEQRLHRAKKILQKLLEGKL